MTQFAMTVDRLGKRYRLGRSADRYGRLTESMASSLKAPFRRIQHGRQSPEWFWALRDVSFELRHGEVLGIIGRNGAGKSTLLKVLARITEPTAGHAELYGRVGSLLEVGTGFHPELSGRENIYLSGAVLGMRRREIDARFDAIVDFAGVSRFLDTPIKRFSSGMQVRLGFAVAAHMETEILIVDEVLAVGDAEFQKRCIAKMGELSGGGRTVLFVSHNLAAVQALCTSACLLTSGTISHAGQVQDVVASYMASTFATNGDLAARTDRQGSGEIRFTTLRADIRTGSPSRIELGYRAESPPKRVVVNIGLFNERGEGALFLSNEMAGAALDELPLAGRIVCELDIAGLLPGTYTANLFCTSNGSIADWVVDATTIDVIEGDFFGTGRLPPAGYGSVVTPQRWFADR